MNVLSGGINRDPFAALSGKVDTSNLNPTLPTNFQAGVVPGSEAGPIAAAPGAQVSNAAITGTYTPQTPPAGGGGGGGSAPPPGGLWNNFGNTIRNATYTQEGIVNPGGNVEKLVTNLAPQATGDQANAIMKWLQSQVPGLNFNMTQDNWSGPGNAGRSTPNYEIQVGGGNMGGQGVNILAQQIEQAIKEGRDPNEAANNWLRTFRAEAERTGNLNSDGSAGPTANMGFQDANKWAYAQNTNPLANASPEQKAAQARQETALKNFQENPNQPAATNRMFQFGSGQVPDGYRNPVTGVNLFPDAGSGAPQQNRLLGQQQNQMSGIPGTPGQSQNQAAAGQQMPPGLLNLMQMAQMFGGGGPSMGAPQMFGGGQAGGMGVNPMMQMMMLQQMGAQRQPAFGQNNNWMYTPGLSRMGLPYGRRGVGMGGGQQGFRMPTVTGTPDPAEIMRQMKLY